MNYFIAALLLSAYIQSGIASSPWTFGQRIAITGLPEKGVFHHLEGAGRKHLAVSDSMIAVAWEDNHRGDPQVYLSTKQKSDTLFIVPVQLSQGVEAYEPSIAALADDHFILAWEQDQSVYLKSLHKQQLGETIKLSKNLAEQVSLATFDHSIYAVWREQRQNRWSLWVAQLKMEQNGSVTLLSRRTIEPKEYTHPVLFPAIAANEVGVMVAWEDRESGHTTLKYSFSADQTRSFSEPQYLNEFFSGRNQYDKGSGVTRVSIAAFSGDEWIAAWMDKRRGSAGYGIYAAAGSDDSFGPNEKVHSEDGDKMPHYNPATAGNQAGKLAVAWDDFRQGTSDIWISSYNDDDEWRTDFTPASASGPAEQTQPAIALDEQNGLHLIWVERQSINAPTRLWYSHGDYRQ